MGYDRRPIDATSCLPVKLQQAFALLARGAQYANTTHGDVWDFAIELHEFSRIGLTSNDLRFLVQLKYVDHAIERTAVGDDRRRFHPSANPIFTRRSCFVLTRRGMLTAHESCEVAGDRARGAPIWQVLTDTSSASGSSIPKWDVDRHTLFLGGRIVKRFKWHAANQITILSAFQEEGWPVRIDDPLTPSPVVHAKRRLSDTIKCLNRNQLLKLIHFRGDGRGQGITWEAVLRGD